MTDRRRINGPAAGETAPPVFASLLAEPFTIQRSTRTRPPNQIRKIFLKTGLTPSAPGSAYLELESAPPNPSQELSLIPHTSSLKLTCTVHGPRPLPRSAPFSPQLLLSTHVKFAPFASRQRRGYIRDAGERDLSVHLEAALRGVIIGDRWPKSGVEIVVTVLEAEEDGWRGDDVGSAAARDIGGWSMMTVLAGCITVASAAIVEAGIDCVDLVSGGVAALVRSPRDSSVVKARGYEEEEDWTQEHTQVVLDPQPGEHEEIVAACVVGYLASRDELTQVWIKGDIGTSTDCLVDRAVDAAILARTVLAEVVRESAEARVPVREKEETRKTTQTLASAEDVNMSG